MNKDNVAKTEQSDPFLQRAVEHWLDSMNELGYQPLFCEWLITKGYVFKYSIKNTHFEQGKDVVAVSPSGSPCAFQLKGGSINLKRWREEVRPEIEALIGCAIQHPDIDKSKPHISYLVTNGEIEDNTRSEIIALNEKVWKDTPLHVWTRGDLLNGFQSMADGILPKDALTYKKLIDLIFSDGTGLPNMAKISSFLMEILNVENTAIKKEQRRRDISAAILYATMIAGSYRKAENHGSVVRIMVSLLALIFHLVDKYELEDKYWIESYKIVWGDILTTAQSLETEINKNGFDSSFTSPFDTDLIPFRKHSAISIIYPLKLSQFISGDDSWSSILLPEVASRYKNTVAVWGEASLIPYLMLIMILKNVKGGEEAAVKLAQNAILQILNFNGRKSKHKTGLIPPYYDLDFAVKSSAGMLEEEFEDDYSLSSYLMKPFVEILARSDQKEFISNNWKEISYMHFEEFIPGASIDYYLWRAETGENRSILPKKEKVWGDLVKEAFGYEGGSLPITMKRFPSFLPFFLAVFPFRANSETIGFLSKSSSK